MSAESNAHMFPPKLMDKLASILTEIVSCTHETPRERAEYIRWNMEQRGAEAELHEFTSWYIPDEPFLDT